MLKRGKKLDHEKPMWDLLPWEQLEEVVKVLTFGAKKYAPENWKKVEDGERRYRAAALRHQAEIGKGIKLDSETGFSHYSHALCSLLFAAWHAQNTKPKTERELKNEKDPPYFVFRKLQHPIKRLRHKRAARKRNVGGRRKLSIS